MLYYHFVGIDVGKYILAICVRSKGGNIVLEKEIDNTPLGVASLLLELQGMGINLSQTLFCCEDTGLYCYHLESGLTFWKTGLWKENAVHLKRSIGLQRGKSDKVDAQRISEYALRYYDKAKFKKPCPQVLQRLKTLKKIRERLKRSIHMISTPVKESIDFSDKDTSNILSRYSTPVIEALEEQLKLVEQEIEQLIDEDENIKRIRNILMSIPGVGKVISTAFVIHTECFTTFDKGKAFALLFGGSSF